MIPIHKVIWYEWLARREKPVRVPEPEAMTDPEQIRAYMKAYEWGGPTSGLMLHHIHSLSRLIRPGDRVLDLACGPGPLLLELARLYPDAHFTGVDLSEPMLAALTERAAGLSNVSVLCEDIRQLPSIQDGTVDVVISTSALHHLPDLASLETTFRRISQAIKPDARLYLFDFGLLKSPKTRALMVADVARRAPAVTAEDYRVSLDAAFVVADVVRAAKRMLPVHLNCLRSRFADFLYFVKSTPDVGIKPSPHVEQTLNEISRCLPLQARAERVMLDWMVQDLG